MQVNYQGSVYTNGQTFTMILDEFETFLGRCRGDLTGTRVLASNQVSSVSFLLLIVFSATASQRSFSTNQLTSTMIQTASERR